MSLWSELSNYNTTSFQLDISEYLVNPSYKRILYHTIALKIDY